MPYQLILRKEARLDIREAFAFYLEERRELAKDFLAKLRERLASIAQNPETYGVRDRPGIREAKLAIYPYLVIYKIWENEEKVSVLRVHHTSRSPKRKYDRRR